MFAPAGNQIAAQLSTQLPAEVFHDPAPHYLEEPRGRYAGVVGVVLAPSNTEQVATIIRAVWTVEDHDTIIWIF